MLRLDLARLLPRGSISRARSLQKRTVKGAGLHRSAHNPWLLGASPARAHFRSTRFGKRPAFDPAVPFTVLGTRVRRKIGHVITATSSPRPHQTGPAFLSQIPLKSRARATDRPSRVKGCSRAVPPLLRAPFFCQAVRHSCGRLGGDGGGVFRLDSTVSNALATALTQASRSRLPSQVSLTACICRLWNCTRASGDALLASASVQQGDGDHAIQGPGIQPHSARRCPKTNRTRRQGFQGVENCCHASSPKNRSARDAC